MKDISEMKQEEVDALFNMVVPARFIDDESENGWELWLGDELEGIFSSTTEIAKYLNLPPLFVQLMTKDGYEEMRVKHAIFTIVKHCA